MKQIKELPNKPDRKSFTFKEFKLSLTDPYKTVWELNDGDIIEFERVITKHKSNIFVWNYLDVPILLVKCKINGFDARVPLSMFKKSKFLKGKICPILSHLREHDGYLYIVQYLHRKTFKVKGFTTCIGQKFDRTTHEYIGEGTIKVPYLIHYKQSK